MTPIFKSITLTRHADGQSITLPVLMGVIRANVGGDWMLVNVPCLTAENDARAQQFLGFDMEQQMHFLYIDGDGITSATLDDYSYTLA
jgi:hypothetical protein